MYLLQYNCTAVQCTILSGNPACTNSPDSQEGRGTKIYVYLPYRGAILFYVYIVPLGLINIFCMLNALKSLVGSSQHVFPKIFYETILLSRKAKFQIYF